MNIRVLKAKLKDSRYAEVEYELGFDQDRHDKIKCLPDVPVHQDLLDGFAKLVPFALGVAEIEVNVATLLQLKDQPGIMISEERELLADFAHIEKYSVTGFSLSTSMEQITFNVEKQLSDGKVLNLTTPATNVDDFGYKFNDVIEAAREEVKLYIEGKRAPKPQLELEFVEAGEQPEKPKRGRKKFTPADGDDLDVN